MIPPIREDEQAWELSSPANARIIELVKAERDRRQAEIDQVVTQAVLFNKQDDRDVLIKGLFPQAADDRTERMLARELAGMIAGAEGSPSVYQGLFDEIGAGSPPDPLDVARAVSGLNEAEREKAMDETGQVDLSDDAVEELEQMLLGQRLSIYAQHAQGLSLYGTVDVLRDAAEPGRQSSANEGTYSVIPASVPTTRVVADDAFVWQWDYWVVEDILRAIGTANSAGSGLRTDIPESPVKRIESIRIGALDLSAAAAQAEDTNDPYRDPYDDDDSGGYGGTVSVDPRRDDPRLGSRTSIGAPRASGGPGSQGALGEETFTGRVSSPDNQTYDIRPVRVSLIVDSARLTDVIDAFGRANFMTVTSMQLGEVDTWADLAEGYYYGDAHVVRAEFDVETVWLRFWTRDAMPSGVRTGLGVVMPEPVAEELTEEDEYGTDPAEGP